MANLSPPPAPRARVLPRKALSASRLSRSLSYAWQGLSYAWRHEPNFRLESWLGLLALTLALWLGVSVVPVLLCSALVLALELLNSSLEAALDLLSPAEHPLVKEAKDAAAAAVLLAAAAALAVGLWHLGPPLWARLTGGL